MHNKAGWKLVIKSRGGLQPSFELGTKEPLVTMGRSLFLAESLRNKDSRKTKPISPAVHRNAFHVDRARTLSLLSTSVHLSYSRAGMVQEMSERNWRNWCFCGCWIKPEGCVQICLHTQGEMGILQGPA